MLIQINTLKKIQVQMQLFNAYENAKMIRFKYELKDLKCVKRRYKRNTTGNISAYDAINVKAIVLCENWIIQRETNNGTSVGSYKIFSIVK
ncbi:hypothetical protein CBL_13354 [Carabus blaptoides fortunei]